VLAPKADAATNRALSIRADYTLAVRGDHTLIRRVPPWKPYLDMLMNASFYLSTISAVTQIPSLSVIMDVGRCVELHNEIVRLGWEGLGRKIEDFERRSWFDFHGTGAEGIRGSLTSDVINFLERAHEVDDEQSFSYYVAGLNYPDRLIASDVAILAGEENPTRYLVLYIANDIPSHQLGVM
jgi:hypothetical protein